MTPDVPPYASEIIDLRCDCGRCTLCAALPASPPAAPTEICICAAIVAVNGEVIRGHRHMDCLRAAGERGLKQRPGHEYQGFVTSRNRYVNREEAARLQIAAGIASADKQHPYLNGECYSEDLYAAIPVSDGTHPEADSAVFSRSERSTSDGPRVKAFGSTTSETP